MSKGERRKLLTPEEVADWLRIDPSSVRELALRGELMGARVGDDWRFDEGAVRARIDPTRSGPRSSLTWAASFIAAAAIVSGAWVARAALSATHELAPVEIPYRGLLERDGAPIDGPTALTFRLFDASTDREALWTEEHPNVSISEGEFSVRLGSINPISERVLAEPELFISVAVGTAASGVALGGRQRLGSTPYARRAGNGVPAGTISAYGGATPPPGWIVCDGRALDGDDATYAELRAALGTVWGDGSSGLGASPGTDFNVPDLRGRFLRGLDTTAAPEIARDEDRSSRAASAPGGRSGPFVGSIQSDAFGRHGHPPLDNKVIVVGGGTSYRALWASGAWNADDGDRARSLVQSVGGSETRPENAAVIFIVKL